MKSKQRSKKELEKRAWSDQHMKITQPDGTIITFSPDKPPVIKKPKK